MKNKNFCHILWYSCSPPLGVTVALPSSLAAGKVEVLHLLHCLSEGTGRGSSALLSVIRSLPGACTQPSAMATSGSPPFGVSSL